MGWLTRVGVVPGVIGVPAFDGSALLIGRVSGADAADTAAQAAADSWRQQHSANAALLAAQASAESDEIVPGSLHISADGAASLDVHRTVSTLIVRHLPHRLSQVAS